MCAGKPTCGLPWAGVLLPGLTGRAHVDYHVMANVFVTAAREGRTTRAYVIDGAGMLCMVTLERVWVQALPCIRPWPALTCAVPLSKGVASATNGLQP